MKFSVTIPSYKSEYLRDAIISVMQQTYQDFELIIVDDCSPEDLKSVVDEFASDDRIRYYRNEHNCGIVNVVDNWNICLFQCSGDYVICIGDDDRMLPCYLEECNKLIERFPEMKVYHAQTEIIDHQGKVTQTLPLRPEVETVVDMLYAQWFEHRKQFIGDFVFSRSWLLECGGYVKFPLAYSSDWATANMAALNGGIANGQVPMFQYRDNESSISRTQNLKLTVDACHESWMWYKTQLLPCIGQRDDKTKKLNADADSYYSTAITDLIYLQTKTSACQFVSNLKYWLNESERIGLNRFKILTTCLRAINSGFLNK